MCSNDIAKIIIRAFVTCFTIVYQLFFEYNPISPFNSSYNHENTHI